MNNFIDFWFAYSPVDPLKTTEVSTQNMYEFLLLFQGLANGLYSYNLNYCYIRSIQLFDPLQNMLRASSNHWFLGCLDVIKTHKFILHTNYDSF